MSESPAASGASRRSVVRATAWTVPVLATAIATPLASASGAYTIAFTVVPGSTAACNSFDNAELTISPAAAGQTVTVTLPDGLTFSDGTAGPKGFATDSSGSVQLVGLRAPSAVGSYTVTGSIGSGAGLQTISTQLAVTVNNRVYNYTPVAGSYKAIPVDAIEVQGNDSAYYVRTASGDVWRWGSTTGSTNDPVTLSGVSNVSLLSTWGYWRGGNPGSFQSGGTALSGGSVYTWTNSGNAVLSVGWPSNIAELQSHDKRNFALTTDGNVWLQIDGGTPTQLSGISGVSKLSSWGGYVNTAYYHGALAIAGNTVYKIDNNNVIAAVSGLPAGIVDVQSFDGSSYALTASGQIYRWGAPFGSNTPTAIPGVSGASSFDAWGYWVSGTYYSGGSAIVDGQVFSWGGNSNANLNAAWGSNVIEVQSHDGATYALREDGLVYRAGDASGSPSAPTPVPNLTGAIQNSSWGNRIDSLLYSSGIALVPSSC